MAVLPFNESVEAIDYDHNKCQLILSSHTGKIKPFQVEKNGKINLSKINAQLYFRNNDCNVEQKLEQYAGGKMCYPEVYFFYWEGESIAVFSLESIKL